MTERQRITLHPKAVVPIYPVTDESIAKAKADCDAMRADAIAQSNGAILGFTADGTPILAEPIPVSTLPLEPRMDLQDAVNALVAQFTFAEVHRCLRVLAAVHGTGEAR
jgi:hypothetical protein